MKVFIDIGHPAHVHYFKNFIEIMKEKGHKIFISARDKEVTFQLLDYYKIPFFNRGKGRKGVIGKLLYIFYADLFILRKALKIKPDLFLSFASPYAAHVSWLMGKPHIAFDDTDHNAFSHIMYVPFTKSILTPNVYLKDHGKSHLRFNSFMELAALHPNHFKPNVDVGQEMTKKFGRYVILRFVSWEASHDMGQTGMSMEDKYLLIKSVSEYANVIISSEAKLPDDLLKYAYSIHPALMHDVLKNASLLISESLTMAAEASFMGTPAICISTAKAGTLDEEVKLGLIELYRKSKGVIERTVEILKDDSYKTNFKLKAQKIVENKIDVTALMVWFCENYPKSFTIMKTNPNFSK